MNDWQRMVNGMLYHPNNLNKNQWNKTRIAMERFNEHPYREIETRNDALKGLFGRIEDDAVITPPLYFDHGPQIYIGRSFYANTGLVILDEGEVRIGDNVFLGPNVQIYTAIHPIDSTIRNEGYETSKPVTIGDSVWVGGGAIFNPGVTVGSYTIIGSGSVVVKDIPDGVIAAGNPGRVIREITEEDTKYWQAQVDDYQNDEDNNI